MSSRILIRILVFVLLLAGAAYAATVYLRPVAVVIPVTRDVAVDAVPATLTVMAEKREIRCDTQGRIAEDALVVGRPVVAGEVLAQLDTASLKIEIEQTEGRIATARERARIGPTSAAELENARAALTVLESRLNSGLESRNDVDKQRRVVEGLEKRVALEKVALDDELSRLEAELKSKQNLLLRMTLTSPIDGVITQVLAKRGDLVNGGSTIAEVMSNTRTVQGQVAEDYFAGIKVGQKATVRLANWGEEKFNATVAKVLPASDPLTQRYLVELNVETSSDRLVPGVTGEAVIILDQRSGALVVPRTAVVGDRVFVVKGGRVEVRTGVKTGYGDYSKVEILNGVQEGELVIVGSLDLFSDGQRVTVKERSSGANH